MAVNHGVYVTQNATAINIPAVAESGIPFVIGVAPLGDDTTATAGVPVLCTSWDEAEEAIGYDADWTKYTLCEFMYSHFKLYSVAPVIFLPLAYSSESAILITNVAASVDKIDLCMSKFGIIPDLIVAPGFSNNATVRAAMAAKATAINGMFQAKALVDLDGASYTAAIEGKNGASFDEATIACWPLGKVGTLTFHMSTIIAGRITSTDLDNSSVPYESPSNKAVPLDSLVNSAGAEVVLSLAQANLLNNAGIVTALNFMASFVAWGNYTAAYPATSDVKDMFIPVSRMFGWVTNTIIKTFWSNLDDPMNQRLKYTVLDTCNIWLNGLVGGGYLLGARAEMLAAENPVTDLMAGIIRIHIYMTPPSPAQEIDFILEYDASYVEAAFA